MLQSRWKRQLLTDISIKLVPNIVDTVAQAVLDRTDMIDKSLWYLVTVMINALHRLLENSWLYSFEEEDLEDWMEVTECNVEDVTVSLMSLEAPSSISNGLGVRRPVLSQCK